MEALAANKNFPWLLAENIVPHGQFCWSLRWQKTFRPETTRPFLSQNIIYWQAEFTEAKRPGSAANHALLLRTVCLNRVAGVVAGEVHAVHSLLSDRDGDEVALMGQARPPPIPPQP